MTPNKLHKKRDDEAACDRNLYQSMVGSLMYAMTATRPDIAYAVGAVSRYSHDPSELHAVAVKRIFRYLAGTRNMRLVLGGNNSENSGLIVHTDSDYAGDPDDFRSTSGLCISFGGGGLIDWRSRKQKSTAQSTTDAEYYAFGVGCMRTLQLIQLLHEFGEKANTTMLSDSQSMIASITNNIYRGTMVTHIATKFYLAIDLVHSGDVQLHYTSSGTMLADAMTKPLPRPALTQFRDGMGMRD
jgi:hypothetical protein